MTPVAKIPTKKIVTLKIREDEDINIVELESSWSDSKPCSECLIRKKMVLIKKSNLKTKTDEGNPFCVSQKSLLFPSNRN